MKYVLSFQVILQWQIKQSLHSFILLVKSLMSPCNLPGAGSRVGVMVGSSSLQGHCLLEETDATSKTLPNMCVCVCVCVCVYICTCMLSHFSCVCLCNSMNHSPPGSSVHEILQARILEWIVMPSFRGSSQPRDRTCVSYMYVFDNYGSVLKGSHIRLWVYDMKVDLIREDSPEEVRCKLLSEGCVAGWRGGRNISGWRAASAETSEGEKGQVLEGGQGGWRVQMDMGWGWWWCWMEWGGVAEGGSNSAGTR